MTTTIEHKRSSDYKRNQIYKRFRQSEGLRHVGQSHICWHELIHESCPDDHCTSPSDIPAFDHGDLWRRNGELVITFQPYGLNDGKRGRLDEFCRERGLQWRECAGLSWHYPGWTTLVIIQQAKPT